MSISSPGIGSGIDVAGLVSSLVAAEGASKSNRLDLKEANFQAEISAFGALKSALSEFQSAIKQLQTLTDFQQRSVVSTNTAIFTATADEAAGVSKYGIEVVQLAQANKLITQSGFFSTSSAVVGSGILKLSQGLNSFSITVSATDTLEDVRDGINLAADNTGLTAAVINVDDGAGGTESKLVFTASNSGTDNAITVEVDEDGNGFFNDAGDIDATGLSKLVNTDTASIALDGQLKVDGQLVSSSDNVFSGVIQGISITSVGVGSGESLSVSLNKSSVNTKVATFVESYNKLVDTFSSLAFYDADNKKAGVLQGDSTLRGIQNVIRRELSSSVTGLTSTFSTLAEIGVTTIDGGKLSIDQIKLDKALDEDFDSLGGLFASDGGLSNKVSDLIEGYVSSSGVLSLKTEGLNESIERISTQRSALNARLVAYEGRLLKQFNALDSLVNSLQNQSSFLTQQLANLPGAYSRNKS